MPFLALLALFVADLTFPSITASNLNKESVAFPQGLKGEKNLVIVAFQRDQQKDVDTWLAVLPAVAASHPKFSYYEVPTIDKLNPMVRWFIDSGMRRGIPDKAQRARTVTFYIDKKPFRTSLGIDNENEIHLFLIDRAGKVLWRTKGIASEEGKQSLEKALTE